MAVLVWMMPWPHDFVTVAIGSDTAAHVPAAKFELVAWNAGLTGVPTPE